MKFYLAGPMTGYPEHNIPAFRAAHQNLSRAGYDIVLPVDLGDSRVWPPNTPWIEYLAADIKVVANIVDGIVFLPDWHRSNGARLEAYVALLTHKKHFMQYHPDTEMAHEISVDLVRTTLRDAL